MPSLIRCTLAQPCRFREEAAICSFVQVVAGLAVGMIVGVWAAFHVSLACRARVSLSARRDYRGSNVRVAQSS